MDNSDNGNFPSLDHKLLDNITDFIYPNELYLFNRTYLPGENELSKDEFKIHIINKELTSANNDIKLLYKRIERLSSFHSSLEKFLTESNDQRYSQFMDTSFYNDFVPSFSETVHNFLPQTRNNFEKYKNSTLFDYVHILRVYNLLNNLEKFIPFLHHFRELYKISKYIKNLDSSVVYRTLACIYGLQYAKNISRTDPKVLETIFFNVLTDHFSRSIDRFLTNIFIKNQYNYDPCEKLMILLIFGRNPVESCDYMIKELQDELLSITSLTIQKYLTLEGDLSMLKYTEFSKRGVSSRSALLCPDLYLLVVSKILSEYTCFFQSLVSKLRYDSKFIQASYSKVKNTGIKGLDSLFNLLNKVDYNLYYRETVDLFVNKLYLLVDESFDILHHLLFSFNLSSLKDIKDVLKIALLILYYITLQTHLNSRVKNDIKLNLYSRITCVDYGFVDIINNFFNKIPINLKNDEDPGSLTGLEKLKNLISSILLDYIGQLSFDTMENVSIALNDDPLKRLVTHPIYFQNMELDYFCNIFKKFINNGDFLCFNDFKFTTLNPFLCWTPNSNFASINICSHLFLNYTTPTNYNKPTSGSSNISNDVSDKLKGSKLAKNYGGVYTLTSRIVLNSFEHHLKVLFLSPGSFTDIIKSYTQVLDEFIHNTVHSCRMEQCVIENLKKFNYVFNSPEKIEKRTTRMSTCDTFRENGIGEEIPSDLSRLSSAVNVVESSFTLLELLVPLINQNRLKNPKIYEYLTNYYNERNEVIIELRLMLYHISMYNLLRPKIPSVRILQAIRDTQPLHIDTDLRKSFSDFQRHLVYLKNFVESADSGSFPVMVYIFLWDSIINIIKDSFKPIFNILKNCLNSELAKVISKNYSEILTVSSMIRAQYVEQVKADYKEHKEEIANMGTYYNLVKQLVKG